VPTAHQTGLKVGRNDPCPCGSGKKYKKCHGSGNAPIVESRDVRQMRARSEALRIQRERQQGLGKPIISAEMNGERFVAVKNRLFHARNIRTFHDFLMHYIAVALGAEWGNAELVKPAEERHPIIKWYQAVCAHQRTFMTESGKVQDGPMTGAAAAYLRLAYDLYTLEHNAELQRRLLARLRNPNGFPGARYEVYVAAIFIRAGFDLAFENEEDGATTHCEFTATYRRTGKRFSVEAKRREGRRLRIGHLFNDAQSKRANHTRVIFIDVNTRDDARDRSQPLFLTSVHRRLRSLEGRPLYDRPRPPAYVFLTNTPWEHYIDGPEPQRTLLADGFQIPDFKQDARMSLRALINARAAHIEMHDLLESIKDHSDIPSTFDGEIPEFEFHRDGSPRLLIGSYYLVPGQQGLRRPAKLRSATVVESERKAYCAVTFDDGQSVMCTVPLSDAEMAAWKRYPDTFFGEVTQRKTHADTPLEMYDFFNESFKRHSKKELLEALKDAADFDRLSEMSQPELASIYAERMALGALARRSG
jgi:SEC-C motif